MTLEMQEQRARRRFEILRTLLAGLVAAVVLTSLILSLLRVGQIKRIVEQNRNESKQVQMILENQQAQLRAQQGAVDAVLARVAADLTRQLAVHDASVKRYLSRRGPAR